MGWFHMTPPCNKQFVCQQQAPGGPGALCTQLHCSISRWRASIRRGNAGALCHCPVAAPATARRASLGLKCSSTSSLSTTQPQQIPSTSLDEHGTPSWRTMLAQLAAWQAEHGSCHVPRNTHDAQELAEWVIRTRKAAKKGRLSSIELEQLDKLGFVWKPDVLDAKWHSNYHLLRQWHQEQGHVQLPAAAEFVPTTSLAEANVREVSVWLARQQQLYSLQKLTQQKVQLLRKLGVRLRRQAGPGRDNLHPVLQGLDPATYRRGIKVHVVTPQGKQAVAAVEERWQLLQAQQQQQQQQQQQIPLADSQCSTAEQGSGDNASAAEAEKIDQRPGSYDSQEASTATDQYSSHEAFVVMLGRLQRWRALYNSCHVPEGVFDQPQLAKWVQQVRQAWVAKELRPWQERELDASGFVFVPTEEDTAWHAQCHNLRHWKALHGHLQLHSDSSPESASEWDGLAVWLEEQQALWAAGALTDPVRLHLLRRLGAVPLHKPRAKKQQRSLGNSVAGTPVLLGTHPKGGHALFGSPPPKK